MSSLKSVDLNLVNELEDKEFREVYFEEWSNDEVADQIRSLRKKRNCRQKDVADISGMGQSAISRIEQSDYSGWSFATLLRIGQALDARVRVVFEPAEDVIAEYRKRQEHTTGMSALVAADQEAKMNRPTHTYLAQPNEHIKAARRTSFGRHTIQRQPVRTQLIERRA